MSGGKVAGLVGVFMLGIIGGQSIAGDPEIKYKVLHKTEEVEVIKEVEVAYTPDECADVIKKGNEIYSAATELNMSTAKVLDIMSRTRKAVAMGDSSELNALETEIRKAASKTVGASQVIGEARNVWEESTVRCEEGIQ